MSTYPEIQGELIMVDREPAYFGGEALIFPNSDGVSIYNPSSLTKSTLELHEQYLGIRHEFSKIFDWPSKDMDSDKDRYDDNTQTSYVVISFGESGQHESVFDCGMRLTPIETLEESLSWEMLTNNPQIIDNVSIDAKSEVDRLVAQGNAWDLTRLVANPELKTDTESRMQSFIKMFAAGIHASEVKGASEPVWMFTTTKSLWHFLNRLGIEPKVVAQGKISPDDKDTSLFGYITPKATYDGIEGSVSPELMVHAKNTYAKLKVIN